MDELFAIPEGKLATLVVGSGWSSPRFLAGPENAVLAAACAALPTRPTWTSPLVIWGPSGSGKSLLLGGLERQALAACGETAARRLTAAEFAAELNRAHRADRLSVWRAALRQLEWFGLDDLESLGAFPSAQGELRHLLDALADRGAAVVITSRVAPAQASELEPGLRGRLLGGLPLGIAPASVEVLVEIARLHALGHDWKITEETVECLAREACGLPGRLITQLTLLAELTPEGRTVTVADAERHLALRRAATAPSLAGITRTTARQFGVSLAEMRGPSRRRSVVLARGIAMYFARRRAGLSLTEIGRYFAGRDHTTVLHQCQKLTRLSRSDRQVQALMLRVEEALDEA